MIEVYNVPGGISGNSQLRSILLLIGIALEVFILYKEGYEKLTDEAELVLPGPE